MDAYSDELGEYTDLEVNVKAPQLVRNLRRIEVGFEHFEEFGQSEIGANVGNRHQTFNDRNLCVHTQRTRKVTRIRKKKTSNER